MFDFKDSKIAITGVAGFIGSHMAEKLLLLGANVIGIDNFVTGSRKNIEILKGNSICSNFDFVQGDLLDEQCLKKAIKDVDAVFHLAITRPVYNEGFSKAVEGYKNDVLATFCLLKSLSELNRSVNLVFASSGFVYGNASISPIPENYGPLAPVSPYGASKLASEAFISSFCHAFDMKAAICRLVNTEGSRKQYGIIFDLLKKLSIDNRKLELLGDPKDKRSYLHVSDCVDALLFCLIHLDKKVDYWNVGPGDAVAAKDIADIIIGEMGIGNIPIISKYNPAEQSIKGNISVSMPSVHKIQNSGWMPKYSSEQAVRLAISEKIFEEKGA